MTDARQHAERQTVQPGEVVEVKAPGQDAPAGPGPGGAVASLPHEFVLGEIKWRFDQTRHRTNTLLTVGKMYISAVGSLFLFGALVGKILPAVLDGAGVAATGADAVAALDTATTAAAAGEGAGAHAQNGLMTAAGMLGLALVVAVVFFGVFFLRFAGYVFRSNIVNRKRIVSIRSNYLTSIGALDLAPEPFEARRVWINQGYNRFPYLLAFVNFLLLAVSTLFLYWITQNVVESAIWTAGTMLVISVVYPKLCHEFHRDIWIARRWGLPAEHVERCSEWLIPDDTARVGAQRAERPRDPMQCPEFLRALYGHARSTRRSTQRWLQPLMMLALVALVITVAVSGWFALDHVAGGLSEYWSSTEGKIHVAAISAAVLVRIISLDYWFFVPWRDIDKKLAAAYLKHYGGTPREWWQFWKSKNQAQLDRLG